MRELPSDLRPAVFCCKSALGTLPCETKTACGYFRASGYSRSVSLPCQAYCVTSLNIKDLISPTPLNCVLKALALKDSTEAFVSLSSK